MKKTLKSILLFLIVIASFLTSSCKKDAIVVTKVEVDENTFIANDIASLQEGIKALKSKTKTKLYIEKMIECDDNSCCFVLEGLSDITIFGNSNSTTGIRRTDGYSEKSLIIFRSCSNIILQDVTFDEMEGSRYIKDYPATLWVRKSSDVHFNSVTVKGSKGVISIGVYDAKNFSIFNSTIEDVGAFGLWVDNSTGLMVKGCTFKDNRSNALFIEYVYGNKWGDNVVVANNFEHNHCDAVFNACGGPCPGGQLDIINASYLTIKENNIYDGIIDNYHELGLFSCGIELNDGNHILIEGNTFWNNTGTDLYMNSGHKLTEVYVKKNSFDNSLGVCMRNMEQAILIDNTCD